MMEQRTVIRTLLFVAIFIGLYYAYKAGLSLKLCVILFFILFFGNALTALDAFSKRILWEYLALTILFSLAIIFSGESVLASIIAIIIFSGTIFWLADRLDRGSAFTRKREEILVTSGTLRFMLYRIIFGGILLFFIAIYTLLRHDQESWKAIVYIFSFLGTILFFIGLWGLKAERREHKRLEQRGPRTV